VCSVCSSGLYRGGVVVRVRFVPGEGERCLLPCAPFAQCVPFASPPPPAPAPAPFVQTRPVRADVSLHFALYTLVKRLLS